MGSFLPQGHTMKVYLGIVYYIQNLYQNQQNPIIVLYFVNLHFLKNLNPTLLLSFKACILPHLPAFVRQLLRNVFARNMTEMIFCETVIHMTRSTHWCESQNVKLTTRIFQKTTFWHQQSLYNSYLLDHISRKLTELWCLLCTPSTSQTKIIYILQGAQKFFIYSTLIHLFAQLNISEAFLIDFK